MLREERRTARSISPLARPRPVAGAFIVGVLAIGLCGCGSTTSDRGASVDRAVASRSSASTAPSGSTASTATAAGSVAIPEAAFAHLKPFTGPAAQQYGQAALRAAYQEMVNFAFQTGWSSTLIRKGYAHLARADFANARSYMTPGARKTFDAIFVKVVQADKVAARKLEESMFFGVTGPHRLTPVQKGHLVTARKFTQASVSLDSTHGAGQLAMSFAAKADIQLKDPAGVQYTMPTSRVLRYWLVQNAGPDRQRRPFLLDSWETKMSVSTPQVTTQPAK